MAPTPGKYGSWRSPITADFVISEVVGLSDIRIDGATTYWAESRPKEAGRMVIVRCDADGILSEINPAPFNARTRVHEYGGGAYTTHGEFVFAANFADQKLYKFENGTSIALTSDGYRYADCVVDQLRSRLVCVQEDHTNPDGEPVNSIVAVDIKGGAPTSTLVSGNDFYSNPRLNGAGTQMSWLTWNHPNMPWFGTELWVADVDSDGALSTSTLVAGGMSESIFQPEWSPNGVLHFVSDKSGWWNLYRAGKSGIEALFPMDAEFAVPQWTFGLSCYAFASEDKVVCTYTRHGIWKLCVLCLASKELKDLGIEGTEFGYVRVEANRLVVKAGSPSQPVSIIQKDLGTGAERILRRSITPPSEELKRYISEPEPYEFKTSKGLPAFGFLYKPKNKDFAAPTGELPPLIVKSHGGPTAAASATLDYRIQYWTSRGYAVFDINYGGSTGYGREYRERLEGQWGVVDVDDCMNGARALATDGIVNARQLLITGVSAGGYTALCALTFFDLFAAGASYYGISDLEALAKDIHKFESHYMDWLVAPYPAGAAIYKERSPINFASKISAPMAFFQGEEDKIVPPIQTEMMVEALRTKGLPFGLILFAGEQHGFRRVENIKRCLEAELSFYDTVTIKSGLRL